MFTGGTTTTTRHFAAWEQTTHFPRGHHTHPLLAASASLNSSPLIRPIPNRLASPPRSPLTSEAKSSLASPQGLNLVKLGKKYLLQTIYFAILSNTIAQFMFDKSKTYIIIL